MKYKLINGRHQGPGVRNQPNNYEKGDVIESDEPLDTLFPNKFKKVKDSTPATCTNPGSTLAQKIAKMRKDSGEEDIDITEPREDAPSSMLGVPVTREFAGAKEAGFIVYKNGKKFNVAETAFPDVATNETPLTKTQVIKLIHDNMPEEPEEDQG